MFRGPASAPGEHVLESAEPPCLKPSRPIGKIQTIVGSLTVSRAGTALAHLGVGDFVYEADVIETGADSTVCIHFSDGTVFELSACTRMVLSEFACDGASSNSALFGLVKGAIAFMAGRVAKGGGLSIDTPVARIRGSRGGGIAGLTLAALTFALLDEVRADDQPVIDDDELELPHGTFVLETKEKVPRIIVVDDPLKTVVLRKVGSTVEADQVTNSSDRMDELEKASRDTFAIYRLGQQDPFIQHQQHAALGGGETRSDFSNVSIASSASSSTPDLNPSSFVPLSIVPVATNSTALPDYQPPILVPVLAPVQVPHLSGVMLAIDSGSSSSDSITNIGTLVVSGVQAGAAVQYSIDGGATWTSSFSAVEGANTVLVRQADSAGNVSAAVAFNFILDTVAPGAPTIASVKENPVINASEASDGTPVVVDLTGTGAMVGNKLTIHWGGQTVEYTLQASDITSLSATVTVPAATITAQGDGTFNVTAQLTDAAGNVSSPSPVVLLTVDTTIVTLAAPDLTTDTAGPGGTTGDDLTKDNTPDFAINVSTAIAGDTIELLADGSSFATPVTHTLTQAEIDAGSFTLTAGTLTDGAHQISVKLSDAAGNSTTSAALTVTVDTTIVTLAAPDLTTDTAGPGGTTGDDLTKDNTPDFAINVSTAIAGDTIELLADGSSFATPVTHTLTQAEIDAGSFTLTAGTLTDGAHQISVKLSDAAGNSTTSAALTVTVDTTIVTLAAPDLTTDTAGPGGTTGDDLTKDNTPDFAINVSTAIAGDTIELLADGSSFATPVTHTLTQAEIDAGSFTLTAGTLTDGAHQISVKLSDAAGNSTTSAALTVTVDTTIVTLAAPDLTTDTAGPGGTTGDDLTKDNTPDFAINVSTAIAGDTIELLADGSSFATPVTHTLTQAEIDAGSFTLTAGTLTDGAHQISVKLSDAAGNSTTSAALTVTVDTTIVTLAAPDLTTDTAGPGGTTGDDLTKDNTPDFAINVSTAIAGDTIELLADGSSFATPVTHTLTQAEIDAGSFTLTAGTLTDGAHQISVKLSDAAGNSTTSAALTVTVDTTIVTLAAPDLTTDTAGPGGTTGDDLTKDNTPDFAINVSTAIAGDTIELLADGSSFATPVTHTLTQAEIDAGSFTLTAGTLTDGAHQISVKLSDAAGNSTTSAALTVTVDTTIVTLAAPDLTTDTAGPGGTTGDDLTKDNTPDFAINVSTAIAGDTIELLADGSSFATPVTHTLTQAEIDAGSFTLTAGTLTDGAHQISVKLSDAAGNSTTSAALTVTVDTTIVTLAAPDLTTDTAGPGGTTGDDLTKDNTPDFAINVSTAIAGDTIELLADGSSFATPVTHTLTQAEIDAGSFTLTAGTLTDGAHQISVKLSDAAGNSTTSAALTVTVDTTIVTLAAPDLTTDTAGPGGTTGDDLTKDNTPDFAINVSTAIAGDTIELLADGSSFATPVTHTLTQAEIDAGSFTLTAGTLTDGAHQISVKLSDAAGNSTTSAALTVTVDTTIVTLAAPDLTTDTAGPGGTTGDDLTKDNTPDFAINVSTAIAGDTIELLADGSSFATPVTHTLTQAEIDAGSFTLTAGTLTDGAHQISVKLSDAAGNSTTSAALTVTVDTTIVTLAAPDLTTDTAGPGGTTGDDLTKDNTPDFAINVSTAIAGDTIELLADGSSFATPVTHTLTQVFFPYADPGRD